MLNHASLGVRDLASSGAFYDDVFAPMGITRAPGAKDGEIAFGPTGTPLEICPFWLYQASSDANVVGKGTHMAFGAPTRAAVDAIDAAARRGGATIARGGGLHPDISPDYYGLIFNDPEGHRIEFVALGP